MKQVKIRATNSSALVILIGLLYAGQVPAIDGDYSNPYATTSNTPAQWQGEAVYGGKGDPVSLAARTGMGMLFVGIGISGYVYVRRRDFKNSV